MRFPLSIRYARSAWTACAGVVDPAFSLQSRPGERRTATAPTIFFKLFPSRFPSLRAAGERFEVFERLASLSGINRKASGLGGIAKTPGRTRCYQGRGGVDHDNVARSSRLPFEDAAVHGRIFFRCSAATLFARRALHAKLLRGHAEFSHCAVANFRDNRFP